MLGVLIAVRSGLCRGDLLISSLPHCWQVIALTVSIVFWQYA